MAPVGTSQWQKCTTHKPRRPDCPVSEVITQAPFVGVITKNLSHVGENQEVRLTNVGLPLQHTLLLSPPRRLIALRHLCSCLFRQTQARKLGLRELWGDLNRE